jgi:hypothetical protein
MRKCESTNKRQKLAEVPEVTVMQMCLRCPRWLVCALKSVAVASEGQCLIDNALQSCRAGADALVVIHLLIARAK